MRTIAPSHSLSPPCGSRRCSESPEGQKVPCHMNDFVMRGRYCTPTRQCAQERTCVPLGQGAEGWSGHCPPTTRSVFAGSIHTLHTVACASSSLRHSGTSQSEQTSSQHSRHVGHVSYSRESRPHWAQRLCPRGVVLVTPCTSRDTLYTYTRSSAALRFRASPRWRRPHPPCH